MLEQFPALSEPLVDRRLILACMAVAAFAAFVVLPTTASAASLCETEANHEVCNSIAVGQKIKGHNVGNIELISSSGSTVFSCTSGSITGTVAKNNGTEVEATIESASITGTGAEGKCTSIIGNLAIHTNIGNGVPWCFKTGASVTFTIRGNACNKEQRSITYVVTSPIGTCKYSRSTPIEGGTLTTDNSGTTEEDAILTLSGGATTEFTKEEGGVACFSAGRFRMSFTLETDVEGTSPIYFKENSQPPPETPELTYPTGTRLATGSKIRAHNVGELKLTPTSGSFSCSTAELTGTLNKNNGSEIEATVEGTKMAGTGSLSDCTSSSGSFNLTTNVTSGLPWCLRATSAMSKDEFQLRAVNAKKDREPSSSRWTSQGDRNAPMKKPPHLPAPLPQSRKTRYSRSAGLNSPRRRAWKPVRLRRNSTGALHLKGTKKEQNRPTSRSH